MSKDKAKPKSKPKPPKAKAIKPKKAAPKKSNPMRMVKKPINGKENGENRVVRVNRFPKYYPTEDLPRKLRSRKKPFRYHKRNLRSSITPGTVLILLAGRHKGKHVVFLKQLSSGLLLVTGPYHINGCPLRRINQRYVIATKTRLDVSKVQVPERVNDEYFKRVESKKQKSAEGEIFDTKKEEYSVSDVRKEDQLAVDKALLDVIRAHPEKKYMFGYLGSLFSLSNKQYPHKMIF